MISLQWYSRHELSALTSAVRSTASDGADPLVPDLIVLRDESGQWWGLDNTGQWAYHNGHRWEPGTRPARLEGPWPLPVPVELPVEVSPSPPADLEHPPDSVAAIEAAVARAVAAYQSGRLPSLLVETLLADLYLVDRSGSIWSRGPRTSIWYCWRSDHWAPTSDRPRADNLMSDEELTDQVGASLRASITALLENGPALPEPITLEWTPPDSAQGALAGRKSGLEAGQSAFCTQCGEHNRSASRFCTKCGTELVR